MPTKKGASVGSPFSLDKFKAFVNEYFTLLFVAAVVCGFSFWLGMLYKENMVLRAGGTVPSAAPTAAAPTPGGAAPTAPAPAAPEGPSADQLAQAGAPSADDHVRGDINAKVVLVEYSDFECPFCARFHPTLKQVVDEFDDVAWVYRHYPLAFHPNAQPAAEASECVASLGGSEAFWQYNDLLFENTQTLNMDTYKRLAGEVGVSADAVETCLSSGEFKEKVSNQFSVGQGAGISGTPGTIVFVDGEAQELIPGALPYEQVKATVEKYL